MQEKPLEYNKPPENRFGEPVKLDPRKQVSSIPSMYTQTRITREYLEKLRTIAEYHKRSMLKQLEVMIEDELDHIAVQDVITKREKQLKS